MAKIVPTEETLPQPYFAQRRLLPSFRRAKLASDAGRFAETEPQVARVDASGVIPP